MIRRPRYGFAALAIAGIATATVSGCQTMFGGDAPRVLRVPSEVSTISLAVDEARSGDIVLVAPGVYRESVTITRAGITVRGEDRNAVVLDGGHELSNGFYVSADDVAIENLTVHSYRQNGVMFNGIEAVTGGGAVDPNIVYGAGDNVLSGYRVSYVTAYNNGLYGIYAFASRNGVIEHSYVSGHPDSGFYIGQCDPCNVVLRNNTAEYNAIGYYGTNSSGGVYVINSVFRHNRLGVAPNSQQAEQLSPQRKTVVAGNLVTGNADPMAPEIPRGFTGGGIAIGGGTSNMVVRNSVMNNPTFGILVLSLNDFLPINNRVEENVLDNNGLDLGYAPTGATSAGGNCFARNTFASSLPAEIERVMACDALGGSFSVPVYTSPSAVAGPDYRELPAPGPQPSMPLAAARTEGGAGVLDLTVDLAAIEVPAS